MRFYCNGKKGICDKIKNSHGVCPLDCEFGDGTGGYDIPDEPMTNGDRIRAMTDEELSDFLEAVTNACFERSNPGCPNCPMKWSTFCDIDGWLKQPAKEET